MKVGTRIVIVELRAHHRIVVGRIVCRARVVAASEWSAIEEPGHAYFRCVGEPARGGIIRIAREGIDWARGWKTARARALRVAAALT